MAVVVEVVSPDTEVTEQVLPNTFVEVIIGGTVPVETVATQSVVELIRPGGTVVNVGSGPVRPASPYEGQIWIDTPS